MTHMGLFRLRIELYTAAQTLTGEEANEFWALLEELMTMKEALQPREGGS